MFSERVRRWFRPPRKLRPTRAGWLFFLLVMGVGFAALNTGNNLLYLVLSLMLAFLVLSGVFSESALRGIQIKRRLPPEVFALRSNSIALHISNSQKRVPAFAVAVEDRTRGADGRVRTCGRCFTLRVAPGATDIRRYELEPAQRGDFELVGFRVSTRFPFGLFSKSMEIDAPIEILVYPPVDEIRTLPDFAATDGDGELETSGAGIGAVAGGLREYAPGDPPRRIHWRASRRRDALLVREVESVVQSDVHVRLRTAGVGRGTRFERSVRWAASEVTALLGQGSRVSLQTDHEHLTADSGARHRARLLTFLARIQPGSPATGDAA